VDAVLHEADLAMYAAKNRDRDELATTDRR
jgi:hypothetical protein